MAAAMAVFPTLAEPITIPASKLTAEALAEAGLEGAEYAVLEPADDGVRVRRASMSSSPTSSPAAWDT